MRNLVAVAVVALIAVPSLAAINVSVQSGGQNQVLVTPGQTLTIDIFAGAEEGLNSLSGDIVASGTSGNATSVAGSFAWVSTFAINLGPGFAFVNGQPGPNGGWTEFGSARTDALTQPNGGWVALAQVASYQIQVSPTFSGTTTLSFVPGDYGGWPPSTDTGTSNIGVLTPLVLVIPEPATIALLALGGLLIRRSRR